MITVSIAINGEPIYARTAVNRLEEVGKYVLDDGKYLEHDPGDGAVKLAIKMLKTIQENPDEVIRKKQRRYDNVVRRTLAQLPGQLDIEEELNRG